MMYRSEVIYFGSPGLEADIFEQAMANLGFWVEQTSGPGELLQEVQLHPKAIAVVAANWSWQELRPLVEQIRKQQGDGGAPIFVVAARAREAEGLPDVRVVPPARRLTGIIEAIGQYVRDRLKVSAARTRPA